MSRLASGPSTSSVAKHPRQLKWWSDWSSRLKQTYVMSTIHGNKFRAVFARDDALKADDRISVTFPQQTLHLFSRKSGKTLKQTSATTENGNGRELHGQAQLKRVGLRG